LQTADYAPMIGTCDCESTRRNPDGTWTKPEVMIWRFKYILNGYGVQDETLKADGSHSGGIRQFLADSSKWYVHWYSNKTPTTSLPTWEGGKKGNENVMYKAQKAPNGMDGFSRLTFKDLSKKGFNWVLEWVDKAETIIFPTWKISCLKREE